jgi:hypothetical protein
VAKPVLTDRQYKRIRPMWEVLEEAQLANREVIVSSGGSSDINDAISSVAALGGGVVRIDGLLDMDGDITMQSNVTLMGYGPGTGLRNNTANDYKIQFVGSALTEYNAGNISVTATSFTCTTANEAANFSAGDWVMCRDAGSSPNRLVMVRANADGNPSTGVVTMYGAPGGKSTYDQLLSPTVAPMTGAISYAGLQFMDVYNTFTGTLTIDIDNSHHITLSHLDCYEATVTADISGYIEIKDCDFISQDNTTPIANFIQLASWIYNTVIERCQFSGASASIRTAMTSSVRLLSVKDCIFQSATSCIYNRPTSGTHELSHFTFTGNTHASEIGTSLAVDGTNRFTACVISYNSFPNSNYPINLQGSRAQDIVIAGNIFSGIMRIYDPYRIVIENNTAYDTNATIQLNDGPRDCIISGNRTAGAIQLNDNNNFAVIGNVISGNNVGSIAITGDSSRIAAENVITGNYVDGTFSATTHFQDNVIDGNSFDGNVTFTDGGANTMDRNIFTNNNVDGSVSWNNTDQDYWIVTGNSTNGTLTDLSGGSGTGNIHANNTEY